MIRSAVLMISTLLMATNVSGQPRYEEAMNEYRLGRYDAAYEIFSRLAAEGERDAQFRLGLMYHQGRGVPRNYREAVQWYRRAADQGSALAQNNLGVIYRDGDGIRSNRVVAYMWFSLAAAKIDGARRRVDKLEDELSADELVQAQQLTAEYSQEYMARKRSAKARMAAGTAYYMVQIGLFEKPNNVDRIRDRLSEADIKLIDERVENRGKSYHRLRVGPFESESEAEGIASKVDKLFSINSLVVALTTP